MSPLFPERNDPDGLPPREAWLMAYLDGELGEDDRARVEAWLAEDPAANAHVDEQSQLSEMFADGAPDAPDARKWARTLAGIKAGLEKSPPVRRGPSAAWIVAAWVTAAAVLVAAWMGAERLKEPGMKPADPPPDGSAVQIFEVASDSDVTIDDMYPDDLKCLVRGKLPTGLPEELLNGQVFEVAESDEVAIISMDGGDVGVLVVCDPPVCGKMDMARRGEVLDVRIEPMRKGKDQPPPYWHDKAGSGMTMIVVPERTARSN